MISVDEVRKIAPDPKALVNEELINSLVAELDNKIISEARKGSHRACSKQVKQPVGEILVEKYIAHGYSAKILGNHTVEISW